MVPGTILSDIEQAGSLDEAYLVTTVKGYRRDERDIPQLITVEIWDAGPAPGRNPARYMVLARDDWGREAIGEAAATVEEAIALVPWGDLDREHEDG